MNYVHPECVDLIRPEVSAATAAERTSTTRGARFDDEKQHDTATVAILMPLDGLARAQTPKRSKQPSASRIDSDGFGAKSI